MKDDALTLAIDLGTTYAKMACNRAGNIEVVPNQEGQDQTPCAVWLNRQAEFVAGQRAKNALDIDFANVQLNFVRDLGSPLQYEFPRASVRMKPEELTAVLLKSLRADAEQFVGREIRNAVITVPPAAGLAQCEATKQAAALAGFTHCLLIQDAVAAALAAGLPDDAAHKTVLIYDFGGSGFSASLLRVRDGMFQVVAQAGDSLLGGTSLDREVVERVFLPALQAADPNLNLSQGDPQTSRVYARLLAASEAARLQLSRADETLVFVPGLRVDERPQPIDLECELIRSALERLAEPLVERTITRCDQVLAESRTVPAEVNNVIAVGGMSLMPLVRQRLEDRFGGRIVAARIDPATAAVRGAAIFGASQRLPDQTAPAPSVSPKEEEESPGAHVLACASTPALFQTIGIALHDNRVNRLFEKGTALPARRRVSLRTVFAFMRGQSGDALRLPLIEGESERADRNRTLGTLSIPLENVARDLPPGTEVEVTIEIDESRQFRVSTYIPLLDTEFEQTLDLHHSAPSFDELSRQLDDLRQRMNKVIEFLQTSEQFVASRQVRTDELRGLFAKAERLVPLAKNDTAVTSECSAVLNKLGNAVGEAEDIFERSSFVAELKGRLREARELLDRSDPLFPVDAAELENLDRAVNDAAFSRDTARLQVCLERLSSLHWRILERDPEFWLKMFDEIEKRRGETRDPQLARQLILVGEQAIRAGDIERLKAAVKKLWGLVPQNNNSLRYASCCVAADSGGGGSRDPSAGDHFWRYEDHTSRKVRRSGSRVVPTSRVDKVHFAVSSPAAIQPGRIVVVDVWAHLERQRAEVERRIQQARPQEDPAPIIRPKGPFTIERGTTLFVRLRFPELHVDPPEDVILWEGEIGNASFEVAIPSETAQGVISGLVSVHWEGGLQIARVPLQILVAAKAAPAAPTTQPLHHIRKAFASYANPDRDDVLRAIQGMQKVLPDLDVFLDVVKLRSGENWERRLWQVIPESDVFYLFWSAAAKASPWVEKEWRCALASRGEEFIDPFPLVSPEEVRPPDELSKKHFNDWILAFRRGRPKKENYG